MSQNDLNPFQIWFSSICFFIYFKIVFKKNKIFYFKLKFFYFFNYFNINVKNNF
jgi:hypothetical protein